jgi:hypothetical protein
MRFRGLAVTCYTAIAIAACGRGAPSGPSDGAASRVLEGQTVNAIDGAPAANVSLVVGGRNTTADANGHFRVDVAGVSTHALVVRGSGIVERETAVSGPSAEPARVSLIPASFDLTAFGQMFRPNGPLQRWTTRPSLVVLGSVMSYVPGGPAQYSATSDQVPDDELAELVADMTEGLSILTAGTFTDFASIDIERPEAGTRVTVTRPGNIVVGRYNGITRSETIGFGQWALAADGAVAAGAMFLDTDFDKRDRRRRLLRIHELGHALGQMHVIDRSSIMNPALGADVTEFDRAAAAIAFQRPTRNRAPDVDPPGSAGIRSGTRALEWGPPVFCR